MIDEIQFSGRVIPSGGIWKGFDMALYQPSNITPSTFAGIGGSVVDVNDYVVVSWQVNGTSGMIGFDFDIYENTPESALVKHKEYTRMGPGLGGPFYGTDARGNVKMYVLDDTTPETWASWGLTNGNSYKLKITQKWKNDPYDTDEPVKSVVQNSESVFITRAAPSLSVSPASGTLTSVSQTFTGVYSQEQGDTVSWVRWVLSNATGDVLDDTGTVYTGVLSYSYDGFFSGETYTLACTVQTSSGAEVTVTNNYAVSYDMAEQAGGISLSCNPDDSVTVSWSAGADIPGTPSAEDYGTISSGVLHLAAERSITWDTVNGEDMAFSSPYCFAWRGRIAESTTVTETVNSGTWQLVKTYPVKRSTTVSHTTLPSEWVRNPNASDKGTRNIHTSIDVSTPYARTNPYISTESPLSVTPAGDYAYKTSAITPPRITLSKDILAYSITQVGYVDEAGIREPLVDAYVETVQDGRTLTFTVYSNTTAAYNRGIYVYADVTYADYYYGAKTESPVSGDTGISNPVITNGSSGLSEKRISYSGSRFTIYAESNLPDTYSISYQYEYAVSPANLYRATWSGTQATGVLNSASIQSTTAGGGATASISGNTYTVTEYNPNNTASAQTVVALNYTTNDGIGNDSYRSIVTGTEAGAVSAAVQSTTAKSATVTMAKDGAYTVTMYDSSNASRTAVIRFDVPTGIPNTNLASISAGGLNFATLAVTRYHEAILNIGGINQLAIAGPGEAWNMLAVVRPGLFEVFWFTASNELIASADASFPTELPSPIAQVTLSGEQWCDYVYLSQNSSYAFPLSAETGGRPAEPGWDGNTLFYAAFASDLQAGTVTSDSSLFVALYRAEGNAFAPVGIFDGTVNAIRDYGIKSGGEYVYEMFYISNGTYSAGAESAPMCRRFRQHTLIEAEEDASLPGVYHPVNVWRFRDNVDAGAYTNQNQPVLLENFTKYPLWQPSSPAAKTGTLTALLGRFENGAYSGDDAAAMEALFALSGSVNPLFYRDMKGNLYMVRLAGPISQTVDNRTGELAVSVSVPWVEVGNANGAKIYTIAEG